METLATLAMDIDVRSADPAEAKLNSVKRTARELEDQARSTASAVKDLEGGLRVSGDTATRAATAHTKYSGALSEEATLLLRNAKLQDDWAKGVDKAAAAAARSRQADADLEQKLIDRNAKFRADAIVKDVRDSERAAAAKVKAAQEAADQERVLIERNASFRAAAIFQEAQQAREAAAERTRIAQESANIERTLQERNAAFRSSILIKSAQDEERAGREVAALSARYEGLRSALDPLAGVQATLAQRVSLLDAAMTKGVITADQHAEALSRVTRAALADIQAIDRLQKTHTDAAGGAKLQTYELLNLGRQFGDFWVQVGSGQGVLIPLIQQGPQVADVFQTAAARGVSFGDAMAGIRGEVAGLLAPLAGIGGVLLAVGAALTAGAVAAIQYREALATQQTTAAGLGRMSGLGASDLEASARAITQSTSTSIQAAREMANAYSVAGASSVKSIGELGQATKDLAATMSFSRDEARDYVSGALRDPAHAAEELQGKLGLLTATQLENIQALQESGQKSEAARILMDALRDATGGASERTSVFRRDVDTLVAGLGNLWDVLGQVITRYEQLTKFDPTVALAKQQAAALAKVDEARSAVGRLNAAATAAGNLNLDGSDGRQKIDGQIIAKTKGYYGALGTGDLETAKRLHTEVQALTRARETYLAPAERAAQLADLEVKAAGAKNAAAKVEIAQQRERLKLAGEAVTTAEAERRVRDAGRVAQAQAAASGSKAGAAAALRGQRADNRGDNAIEQSKAAELAAQLATTRDVETIAGIKRAQIAQELKAQEVRLLGQVKTKEISQADADAALSHYRGAAAAKERALSLETANQISQRDLGLRQEMMGFTQRAASLQAAGAKTIEAANAIEANALAERQAYDKSALQESVAQRVTSGEISLTRGKLLLAEQAITQATESEAKAREDRLRIFQRDQQLIQQGFQNEADLLQSRRGLAQSAHQAAQFDRSVAGIRYAAERSALQSTIENKDAKADEVAYAKARLPVIAEIYANELRALDLSDNVVTAYSDLAQALAGAARAVIDGDFGGSISGAAGVAQQLAGLTGGKLGSSLAGFASFAGPIGAAVSAVSSVLGAIGDSSAAKAQAKIERLTKAVEDLRAENKTSSGSIAAALAEANSNWNSDLEYSSAMLSALRSIDAKTGAAAALLARQVSTGGMLKTDGLGLGSTSQGGSLGAGLTAAGLTGAALAGGTGFLMGGFAGALALGPMGLVAGAVGALVGALTKTKKTTEVLDQGLQFTAATFDQIMSGGVTGSSYANLLTTTKKSLLGVGFSTKVKTNTVSGDIDTGLLSQISGVVEALGNGVLSSAEVFGVEAAKAAEAALGSAVVDLGKLSLKDLKSDEIAEVLNATFDKVADQLAAAGVPGLEELASVGEGAFETLTRLAREYQVVDVTLASIGKSFGQVGLASIAARDDLVQLAGGLDALSSQTSFFASSFLSEAEQLAPVIKAVNDNLRQYGLTAESSRDQFKALVLAQDLTTEAGRATYAALLAVAPAFDKVAGAADSTAAKIASAAAEMVRAAETRVTSARSALQDAYNAEKARLDGIVTAAEAAASVVGNATSNLRAAYESQASVFEAAIDRLNTFSQSMKDFGKTLMTGDLSAASSAQRYAATRAEFERVRGLAMAGDATAQGQYQGVAQEFLKASADNSSTALGYLSDLGAVKDATDILGKAATSQVGVAEQQLAQLKAQVSAVIDLKGDVRSVERAMADLQTARLASAQADAAAAAAKEELTRLDQQVAGYLTLNTSVLSVKDAVTGLNAAIMALANAKAVEGSGKGWTSPTVPGGVAVPSAPSLENPYTENNGLMGLEGMIGRNAKGEMTIGGFTAAELAAGKENPYALGGGDATAIAIAIAGMKNLYGPDVLPGFAKGGSFKIAGAAGIDQNLLSINGQPAARVGQGEIVTITPPNGANDNGMGAVVAELRALRQSNADLKKQLEAMQTDNRIGTVSTVKAINRQTETLEKWDEDGLPVERAS